MTVLPASAQQADAVAVAAENGVGENGVGENSAGENVAAEQSAQTQTPSTETLYAEERAYCLQRFEDGSGAYQQCFRLKTNVSLSRAELDKLMAELKAAQDALDLISDQNSELKDDLQEQVNILQDQAAAMESLQGEAEKMRENFRLYRWQNRMKIIVPVVLGGVAASYGEDQDRAVNFMAGVGAGFTLEYFGIGLSPYAGELAYNLSVKLGF